MKNHTFRAIGTMSVLALTAIQSLAQSTYEPYTFTTLAGGAEFKSPDVPGSAARFRTPVGIAFDSASNLYVADTFNYAIRKITPGGEITTLAGLPGVSGSADGAGSAARFFNPFKLALDSTGNLYVTGDSQTIRKVTPEGVVTTIAGSADTPGSADGVGSVARFNLPSGITLDSAGNLYVSDAENHTIRKLTQAGADWVVTTIAGLAGSPGTANGTNRTARFNFPSGLAFDRAGNLYVADTDNSTIRKMSPDGTNWVVTTIAGRAGIIGGADGTNSAARFKYVQGIVLDSAGTIYLSDTGNSTIRQMTPVETNWVVTTLAGLATNLGTADGTGTGARFNQPYDVAVDTAGNLYVTETVNDMIRKITRAGTNWVVTTLAGRGGNYGSPDGPGNVALFKGPAAVTVDSAGNTYVGDQINQTIRKVTLAGEVTTLAGLAGYSGSANGTNSAARFVNPGGLAVDKSGNVYVADTVNHTIRKITPNGSDWAVTTIAGLADPLENGGSADGTGSAARFSFPNGLAVDSAGNIYVADTGNSTIRRVTPTGSVSTRVGSAGQNGSADGLGAAARFSSPYGVAVDSATNIYVADTLNHTIRKITPVRVVTTLAGEARSPGSTDGIGNSARFNFPSSIAVDLSGNLYVADTYNNTMRKLTPAGTNWVVTTLGGMVGFYGTADGVGSAARFSNPNGVAVDSAGNVYVADFYFNTIRKGYPPLRPQLGFYPGLSGSFNYFVLNGMADQDYRIEASENLGLWTEAFTLHTGTNGIAGKSVRQNSPQQFFRAVQP